MKHCPLCQQPSSFLCEDKKRRYLRCQNCFLVWVEKCYQLSAEAEKAEYDKHENNPQDAGYRRFLSRTFSPLLKQLKHKPLSATCEGLDFGCGSGPAISELAREAGLKVENYDLYYFNRPELLERQYDFITLTEVIEHIAEPQNLLEQLDSLLKSSAILAVMTKRVTSQEAFSQWHYKNDPTHICFYSKETFEWIAAQMGWRLQLVDKDVIFFHKE